MTVKARDPVSNRQCQQIAFISEFATDIAHVPGLESIITDALTRQYDDREAAALVHSIAHTLADVDLSELGKEQTPLDTEQASSLKLEHMKSPGVDQPVVCDTSIGKPRVLVPVARRRQIFDAVHNLAHPSGKVTLAIVSKSYVWRDMRRDILCWAKQCKACGASKVAVHTKPPVLPILVPSSRFEHVHVDLVGQTLLLVATGWGMPTKRVAKVMILEPKSWSRYTYSFRPKAIQS